MILVALMLAGTQPALPAAAPLRRPTVTADARMTRRAPPGRMARLEQTVRSLATDIPAGRDRPSARAGQAGPVGM